MQMIATRRSAVYLQCVISNTTYNSGGTGRSLKRRSFYLSVGGPGAACGVLMVAYIHVGGHAAAWVVVALKTETHRFHHIKRDGCTH